MNLFSLLISNKISYKKSSKANKISYKKSSKAARMASYLIEYAEKNIHVRRTGIIISEIAY